MPASSTAQRPVRKQGWHLPAEHSGRIVYADPRSLPSYPTVGVKLDCTNSAALQASQTKSPSAIYTSGPVNPASLKAATAAAASAALSASPRPAQASQSAPVAESSEPPTSPRPAQRRHHQRKTSEAASFSAAPSVSNIDMSTKAPVDTSTWGNSAATQAFRNSQISLAKRAAAPPPKPIPEIAALGPQPSLRAAKGAMKTASSPSLRPRYKSNSTPSLRHQKNLSSPYPEGATVGQASSSTNNALKAATAAAKARGGYRSSLYHDAGSIPYTTMDRQMYTSHPSIGPEHDDQAHEQKLHASAVAMAKRMYNLQADGGGSSVAGPSGMQGTALQEAAYKLAQERLEKLHEKYGKDREFRDYYVDPNQGPVGGSSASVSRRFSVRGRLRRQRSSSESEISDGRSMEIRNQMSQVSGKISAAEDKKRQDRQSVLLAAQRNVKSQLHDIDERVYANSGRVPPATLSSWESKAHAVAQDRANAQLSKYPRADQVDIGGGKFIPRNDVDKLATRNVQPVLDDMHEKQQAEFDRQEVARKEQDDRKAEAILLKSRDKELKELKKKIKREEKEKKNAQKAEEKTRKAEAKAAKKRGEVMGSSKEASKPAAAIIPEAPTHQSPHHEEELEDTDSEVMTAPDTTSSIRETRDADPPSPTTEPEHTVLATESPSKAREPVSPVSPGSLLSPVSPEARTGWVAPAALVTAAATVPAVIVSKGSISSPSAQTPLQAERTGPSASTVPSTPSAPSYVVPGSIALPSTPAALAEAPSTPFTEPRAAPAVPTTPTAATSVAAPAESSISPPAAPYSIAAVSANKATPATAYSPPTSPSKRATGDAQKTRSGRRLSSLFVKTSSKDDAAPKPIEYSEVDHENRKKAISVGGAGAVGADLASHATSGIQPNQSPSSSPTKLASGSRTETGGTDKTQPMSPKSDESSSPKSKSKMRTWFRSRFPKTNSISAASGTDAVQTGPDTSDTTYRAAGTDIDARKTFVGGHALTSAENVSAKEGPGGTGAGASSNEGAKGNISPAIGSGGLSLPAISGIGGFATGATAAAAAAASRVSGDASNSADTKAANTGKYVASPASGLPDTGGSTQPTEGLNPGLLDITGKSKSGGMYPTDSSSHRKPVATETDAKDKSVAASSDDKPLSTEATSNVSASRDAPATRAATTSDAATKTASGPAAEQPTKPGLLDPFASVPKKGTGDDVAGSAAGSTKTGGVSGTKGAATGAAVGGFSYATIVGGLKNDAASVNETGASGKKTFTVPNHSNAPGNRTSYASYASSNYANDGAAATGTRGVSGSGFGLVGSNIFADITKTGTLANVVDANTYVTVPPPATAHSAGTAGTASGESGIDAAYTPPKTLHDPADKTNASPVRDSRFLENLEDQF